ncbi:MAG TPA: bifunctional phosphoglucose/phosphomannose isomerase [Candidatus Eisenbacteria bacterium]|nr:bifunctional phosphoglucose/phosphomannose isomerase [Candidatus Eisenbacteria bacterium]
MSPARKKKATMRTKAKRSAAKRTAPTRTTAKRPSATRAAKRSAAKPAATESREALIARLDPAGMGARIEGLGDQLRRGAAIAAPLFPMLSPERPRRIVLCGMGGSAIAGELLASIIDREGAAPMHVVRHYEPPAWISPEDFLVFSSYSGETEETLAAYRALKPVRGRACVLTTGGTLAARAAADGVPIARLPGGHPPRAALGYSFATLAHLAEHLGVLVGGGRRVRAAADAVDAIASRCARSAPPARNPANTLATRLGGKAILLMASARTLGPAAVRWKGQMNENAKHLAYVSLLPEANHNEVDGFVHPRPLLEGLAAVFLRDPHDHPRVARRFEWLGAYLRRKGVAVETVVPAGEDAMERLLGCVATGDFVSYYLALRNGMDPSALPGVESLKKALQA